MLEHQFQQRTAYLLLVLVGLVGTLGTGLHDLFDCCHHCQCSDSGACRTDAPDIKTAAACDCAFCGHRELVRDNTNSRKDDSRRSIARSHADCAICQLLSLFHTTTTAAAWQPSVYGDRGSLAISFPIDVATSALRLAPPRGPPAKVITGCYA